jgi:exonuclease VII large subunit
MFQSTNGIHTDARSWPVVGLLVGLGILFALPTSAEERMVNWTNLELSPQQQSEIGRLESQWQRMYTELYPQIQRDKNELRRLLNSPQSNERQIMELQTRIQINEQRLRQEATRTFLNKKNQLNPVQKVRLQQMMND